MKIPDCNIDERRQYDHTGQPVHVLMEKHRVVTDDDLQRRRRKLSYQIGKHIIFYTDAADRADRRQYARREIRKRARDQHHLEAFFPAELIKPRQVRAFLYNLFRGVPKDRPHQQKAQDYARRLREPRNDDARNDTENHAVRRRDEDGRQKTEGIDEYVETEAEEHRPDTEGANIIYRFLHIPAGHDMPKTGAGLWTKQPNADEQQNEQHKCNELDRPFRFDAQNSSPLSMIRIFWEA